VRHLGRNALLPEALIQTREFSGKAVLAHNVQRSPNLSTKTNYPTMINSAIAHHLNGGESSTLKEGQLEQVELISSSVHKCGDDVTVTLDSPVNFLLLPADHMHVVALPWVQVKTHTQAAQHDLFRSNKAAYPSPFRRAGDKSITEVDI